MPENSADRIVWIDCEMTGLDPIEDVLVEIACVVTDGELNEVGDGFSEVIAAPKGKLDMMDPFVVNMHTESGLLPLIPSGLALEDAQDRLFAYITDLVPEAGKAPLGGSSVHVDRMFLERYMPTVNAYLHYRIVDVSSIKELVRRWYPGLLNGRAQKQGSHRALDDIRESVAELRFYREHVFRSEATPQTP